MSKPWKDERKRWISISTCLGGGKGVETKATRIRVSFVSLVWYITFTIHSIYFQETATHNREIGTQERRVGPQTGGITEEQRKEVMKTEEIRAKIIAYFVQSCGSNNNKSTLDYFVPFYSVKNPLAFILKNSAKSSCVDLAFFISREKPVVVIQNFRASRRFNYDLFVSRKKPGQTNLRGWRE